MEPIHIHSEGIIQDKSGKLRLFARIFSDLANPMIIPPAVLGIMGYAMNVPVSLLIWILGIAFLCYTLVPFGTAVVLLKNGSIKTLDVPLRRNREELFLYSLGSITTGSLMLIIMNFGSNPIFAETAFVFLVNTLIGYGLNRMHKISIHSASIASAGILIMYLQLHLNGSSYWPGILSLFTLLVLLPLMCWSRFQLGIHNTAELLAGSVAGLLFTLLQVIMLNIIW